MLDDIFQHGKDLKETETFKEATSTSGRLSKHTSSTRLFHKSADDLAREEAKKEGKSIINMPLRVALSLMISGEFAYDNWCVEQDKEYMRQSIITMSTNVSIVGGLMLTILLPPLASSQDFQETLKPVSTAPGFESCTPATRLNRSERGVAGCSCPEP